MPKRIPLARPSWTDEMREAAMKTLDSGRWVKGPQSRAFAEEFANYCGVHFASPCNSGSGALIAALRLLGIGPGDEVIVKKTAKSFEEAINQAADSAERILKRRKEKQRLFG